MNISKPSAPITSKTNEFACISTDMLSREPPLRFGQTVDILKVSRNGLVGIKPHGSAETFVVTQEDLYWDRKET